MNTSLLTYEIISRHTPTIVGGVDAAPGEYPHMAALGYGDDNKIQYSCGGSLISNRYVMTAAHCLNSNTLGQVRTIRLGDYKLDGSSDTHEDFGISEVVRHPDYHPPDVYNDIALIKLDRVVVFNRFIKPAKLFNDINRLSRYRLTATGWGRTAYGGQQSNVLQTVELSFFTQRECNKHFGKRRKLSRGVDIETQVCAGGRNVEKDTCGGDSGGPLQMSRETYGSSEYSGWSIVGVTSIGKTCGVANVPAIYTRVSHYLTWIKNIIKS